MSPLADDSLDFVPPGDFSTRVAPIHKNRLAVKVLWAGLKPSTRRTYNTAARSFESFCTHYGVSPWPASFYFLCEWLVGRAFGQHQGMIPNQSKILPATISAYLSALRSVHVDLKLPTTDFDDDHMKRLMAGIYNLFPASPLPKHRSPMTKELLLSILHPHAMRAEAPSDAVQFNAAYSFAFGGFMRMGELTHSAFDESSPDFPRTRLTIRCLTISPSRDSIQLFLPRSKADKTNRGVTIVMAATGDLACPVQNALALLSARPAADPADPLFSLPRGGFERDHVVGALRHRLAAIGLPSVHITGHSFRRGAAQHADRMGLTRDQIMALGRWSSDAVDRYYTSDTGHLFLLQQQFAQPNQQTNNTGV